MVGLQVDMKAVAGNNVCPLLCKRPDRAKAKHSEISQEIDYRRYRNSIKLKNANGEEGGQSLATWVNST